VRYIAMSYLVLRVKNDISLKSRLLYSLFRVNPSYTVKEYREEPDPADDNYSIISITSYEKSPYNPIDKILKDYLRTNEIEYLNRPAPERYSNNP
jgi:hypothetical protein